MGPLHYKSQKCRATLSPDQADGDPAHSNTSFLMNPRGREPTEHLWNMVVKTVNAFIQENQCIFFLSCLLCHKWRPLLCAKDDMSFMWPPHGELCHRTMFHLVYCQRDLRHKNSMSSSEISCWSRCFMSSRCDRNNCCCCCVYHFVFGSRFAHCHFFSLFWWLVRGWLVVKQY